MAAAAQPPTRQHELTISQAWCDSGTHLDDGLAQCRGVADAQRRLEVVVGDGHGVEDLGVDLVVLQVDDVHLLPDALQRRLRAQRRQVGADIPVREQKRR